MQTEVQKKLKHLKHVFDQRPESDPLGGLRGLGQKVKNHLFQNMVMLHIKLKGIRYAATWKQTFCKQSLPPPPRPWGQGHKVKIYFFSKHGHVVYQIK